MSNTVVNLPKRNNWTKGGPVVSQLNEEEITLLEARATATVADPTVLGLWGFATGTWIVGTVIADIFPASAFTATIPVLLVFAGLTQFIAGLFAFRRTNVLAATGAFNVLTALLFAMQAHGTLAQTGDPMVIQGFVLESFAFIALALMLAAMRTNMGLVTVLGTLGIGYALSGIPDLANAMTAPGWSIIKDIGGWFLVASAFFAFYTGMALVVNSTWNRTVLPIGGEP